MYTHKFILGSNLLPMCRQHAMRERVVACLAWISTMLLCARSTTLLLWTCMRQMASSLSATLTIVFQPKTPMLYWLLWKMTWWGTWWMVDLSWSLTSQMDSLSPPPTVLTIMIVRAMDSRPECWVSVRPRCTTVTTSTSCFKAPTTLPTIISGEIIVWWLQRCMKLQRVRHAWCWFLVNSLRLMLWSTGMWRMLLCAMRRTTIQLTHCSQEWVVWCTIMPTATCSPLRSVLTVLADSQKISGATSPLSLRLGPWPTRSSWNLCAVWWIIWNSALVMVWLVIKILPHIPLSDCSLWWASTLVVKVISLDIVLRLCLLLIWLGKRLINLTLDLTWASGTTASNLVWTSLQSTPMTHSSNAHSHTMWVVCAIGSMLVKSLTRVWISPSPRASCKRTISNGLLPLMVRTTRIRWWNSLPKNLSFMVTLLLAVQ